VTTRTTITLRDVNRRPERIIDWLDDFMGPQPYAFMSNFYERPVTYLGLEFPTTEHAFAWAKVDPDDHDAEAWRDLIAHAEGPGSAKSYGRKCPLRPDWEAIKFNVMHEIVWAKFDQNVDLAAKLLATGDAYIQEGTLWGDEIWGVDLAASDHPFERPGTNWLGTQLMEVRARLRAGA
jgi:ribA/ribD-fused uncharacterized protein